MAKKITATEALDALYNHPHSAYIAHIQQHINYAMSQATRQLELDLYGFNRGAVKIRKNKGFKEVKYFPFLDPLIGNKLVKYEE